MLYSPNPFLITGRAIFLLLVPGGERTPSLILIFMARCCCSTLSVILFVYWSSWYRVVISFFMARLDYSDTRTSISPVLLIPRAAVVE